MYSFLSVLFLFVLSMGATTCGGGGEGKEPGVKPGCDALLEGIENPPARAEDVTRERIITFVLENKETLESMDAEAAALLWECLGEEPE